VWFVVKFFSAVTGKKKEERQNNLSSAVFN
jgi:hypothetical protein